MPKFLKGSMAKSSAPPTSFEVHVMGQVCCNMSIFRTKLFFFSFLPKPRKSKSCAQIESAVFPNEDNLFCQFRLLHGSDWQVFVEVVGLDNLNFGPGGGRHGRRRGRSGAGAVNPSSRARYTDRNTTYRKGTQTFLMMNTLYLVSVLSQCSGRACE